MSDHHHEHGHEHEHAYEHGHGHGHGHEHEHAHEHGHEHGHERVLLDDGNVYLTLMEHQGSLVASYRFQMTGKLDTVQDEVASFATGIADAVTSQGGLVGHVKAFAQEIGDSCRISVTLHDPDIMEFENETVKVEGVAIVMLVDEDWYAQLITQRVQSIAGTTA